MDTYVAAHNGHLLFDHEILANKMFDTSSGYGIVLSGEALYIAERCREYIAINRRTLTKNIETNTKTIQVSSRFRSLREPETIFKTFNVSVF